MLKELAGVFGWFVIILFVGTLLNYVLKPINKKYGKTLKPDSFPQKLLKFLMRVFVMNHKYFGIAAGIFLLFHFILEFLRYGMSISGLLAAVVMLVEIVIGVHAKMHNKVRRGTWFIVHRIVTVVILITIVMHLVFPWVISRIYDSTNGSATSTTGTSTLPSSDTNPYNNASNAIGPTTDAQTADSTTTPSDTSPLPTFTLEEVSQKNGQKGNKAYVVYHGNVYDVSNHPQWQNGTHHGEKAGTDISNAIGHSPHGPSVLNEVPIIGTLQ